MSKKKTEKDSEKIKSISFRLVKIDLRDFAINNIQSQSELKDKDNIKFKIQFGLEFIKMDQLSIELNCSFFFSEIENMELGRISSSIRFSILNATEFTDNSSNPAKINIPDDVMMSFISIALSTTRGMLAVLIRGSQYESAILPIINPQDVLKSLKNLSTQPIKKP